MIRQYRPRRVVRRRKVFRPRANRTVYRRRPMVPRAPTLSRQIDTYAFKRTTSFTLNNSENDAVFLPQYGYKFSLDDLPDYTDFTNLFNLYQITTVVLRITLDIDPGAQTATNAQIPQLWMCNEFTSATNWVDANDAQQTQRKKQYLLKPNYTVKHVIRPATFAYGQDYPGSAGDWATPQWRKWIPTTEPSVQHGYVRVLLKNFPSVYTARVDATYYVKCKQAQ